MRPSIRQLEDIVGKVRRYVLKMRPESFNGWTREALEDYLISHFQQGTIEVVMMDDEVVGLIIAWKQKGFDHIPWNWQKHNKKGDVYWYDQFMGDCPQTAMLAAVYFCESHRDCVSLPGAGFRNGKLKRYSPGFQWKLYKKAEGLYGN
jgi:hypothetical protein